MLTKTMTTTMMTMMINNKQDYTNQFKQNKPVCTGNSCIYWWPAMCQP